MSKTPEKSLARHQSPRLKDGKKTKKENAHKKKSVVCQTDVIFRSNSPPPKKSLFCQKDGPDDFVKVKQNSKEKAAGPKPNEALSSFLLFFWLVQKAHHFFDQFEYNTVVKKRDDSTAKDRLRMGARGDDRRRQRVFYIQRTAARVSRREESRGGGRARGEREEAIGKIERCICITLMYTRAQGHNTLAILLPFVTYF